MNAIPQPLQFDQFVLDEANARLTQDGRAVPLPPKALAVLCTLARQAGQLVKKDALLDAVWGHRYVSESVLKTTISQLRAALVDNAGEPRYIETVSRHGYRFIGKLAGAHAGATPPATDPAQVAAAALPPMVGRIEALARLRAGWQRAQAGDPQLFWVEGDAGIGKSTLIDHFVLEAGAAVVARGQCVEQYGAGEPYLPILEALKELTRRDAELVKLMRQVAPTWLVQMPWLIADGDRGALQAELAGAGQERMVRELWELLERYTQRQPLLLVTEDLHWSDHGTLRLMDHFARRRGSMRLMWLASFRLTQVIAEEHPLQQLRQELRLHRLCEEIPLDTFSESEVGQYLESRLTGNGVSEGFVRALHLHTDGLPLFVVSVLESLDASQDWSRITERTLPVPDNLAGAIEKQLAKLPAPVRAALEAASVCGVEFRAAMVGELIDTEATEVASHCDELVRGHYWLREAGIIDLPDGRLEAKYVFSHAVYRHVFYQRLTGTQRLNFHRRAARSLERAREMGLPVTAAELASHYELGREYRAAVVNFGAAAESALAHYAPQEALQLAERGLALLPQCTAGDDRLELELSLQASRGIASSMVHGIAVPRSGEAFQRVIALCDLLPQTPERVMLLNAVGWNLFTRCDFAGSIALAQKLQAVGADNKDPMLYVFGCNLLGVTYANLGKYTQCRDWLQKGIEVCHGMSDRFGVQRWYVDPDASMHANLVPALVHLGMADSARSMVQKAFDRATRAGHPLARLVAYWCGCLAGTRLEDVDAVDRSTVELEKLASSNLVHQAIAPARWFRGWVEVHRGNVETGLRLLREGLVLYTDSGTHAGSTETHSYIVEALIKLRRWDEAQAALDEANAVVDWTNERLYVAELRLQQAEIAEARNDHKLARRSRETAVLEARACGALYAEIRALTALVGCERHSAADIEALREAYNQLTEGFGAPVITRARELLADRDQTQTRPRRNDSRRPSA